MKKVNKKGISQGCGTRSYLRLMLNQLKEMGGFTFIYTPWGPNFRRFLCKRFPCGHQLRKLLERFPIYN